METDTGSPGAPGLDRNSEKILVDRCRRGDKAAYDVLVRTYPAHVYVLAGGEIDFEEFRSRVKIMLY